MFRYRAGVLIGHTTEVTLGLMTREELEDRSSTWSQRC